MSKCGTTTGRRLHIRRGDKPCDPCATAHRRYMKRREFHTGQLQAPPIGVARRLQALAVVGHSSDDLAPLLGVNPSLVRRLRRGTQAFVRATTHRRVDEVFRALQMTPGTNESTARQAKQRGWVPAFAWESHTIDDPNALPNLTGYNEDTVQALLAGELPEYELVDLDEVVRRMPGQGSKSIANRLGISWHICQGALERVRKAAA